MIRNIFHKLTQFVIWEDLLRYPRFFISSMIGLILILLNPIITQLKKVDDKKFIYFFLLVTFLILFWVLKEMISFE